MRDSGLGQSGKVGSAPSPSSLTLRLQNLLTFLSLESFICYLGDFTFLIGVAVRINKLIMGSVSRDPCLHQG